MTAEPPYLGRLVWRTRDDAIGFLATKALGSIRQRFALAEDNIGLIINIPILCDVPAVPSEIHPGEYELPFLTLAPALGQALTGRWLLYGFWLAYPAQAEVAVASGVVRKLEPLRKNTKSDEEPPA